jgi:rhodanese-related sulfurtransferase
MNKERIVFVDVRNEDEYKEAHIRNAIHIPADELADRLGRIERYKTEPIVIVCGNGKRSAKATSQLKKAGFKDVSSMEGGMKAWISDSMPTESSEAESDNGKAKKKGKA